MDAPTPTAITVVPPNSKVHPVVVFLLRYPNHSFSCSSLSHPRENGSLCIATLPTPPNPVVKRRWLFSLGRMENDGNISNSHENQSSDATNIDSREKLPEKPVFINHGIAWHERRREWVGDLSQKPQRARKESVIGWTTSYEDLLLTNEPFKEPIALAEMVDFLVDNWHLDGLYD